MSETLDLATLGDVASIILSAEASDARAIEYRDAYLDLHETASKLLSEHNSNICDLKRMERMHQQRCEQLARARSEINRLRELCLYHGIAPEEAMEQPKRMKLGV